MRENWKPDIVRGAQCLIIAHTDDHTLGCIERARRRRSMEHRLGQHPFGLPVPEEDYFEHFAKGIVYQLFSPGSREDSFLLIQKFIENFPVARNERKLNYLRVIKAQYEPGTNKFDWFYEIGMHDGAFLGGGWPDYCGQYGLVMISDFFAFLEHLYGIKIETIEIPYESAEPARRFLYGIEDDSTRAM